MIITSYDSVGLYYDSQPSPRVIDDWTKVVITLEPVGGKIEELVDLTLVDDKQNVRVVYSLEGVLDANDATYIASFFASNSQRIAQLSSVGINDVVCTDKKLEFGLFGGRSYRAKVKMTLKCKNLGSVY
jgi:hypothetical protein